MGYKNILWIDDCEDNNSGDIESDLLENERDGKDEDNSEIIRDYFGDYYTDVNLVKEYSKAIQELRDNHLQYDLVVFDMNMNKGIELGTFGEIKSVLQENRVLVKEKNDFNEFVENAGIYLYLYLLNLGYPNSRMIILTGNGTISPQKRLENACISVDETNLVNKKGGTIESSDTWIKQYYTDSYYCVRRMVYKACEYWKKFLKELDDKSSITFNKLYYDDKNLGIEKELFFNMLERAELLFPVIKPSNCEGVYYHVLQVVTMFHEESANIGKLDKYPEIKKYHQTVRNFRNWSAHNKFNKTKINVHLFVFIFCISLRTYFEEENVKEKKQLYKDEDWFWLYEKEAFESITVNDIEYESYEKYYRSDWERHFNKVNNSDNAKKKCWECNDISRLLLESGNCDNRSANKMELLDCILNLLENHLVPDKVLNEIEKGYLYTLEYNWKCEYSINEENVNRLLDDNYRFFDGWAIRLYMKLKNVRKY